VGVGSIAEMGFELAANLISLIFLSFEAFMRMQGAGLLPPHQTIFPHNRRFSYLPHTYEMGASRARWLQRRIL
jgi:hypothetical protein